MFFAAYAGDVGIAQAYAGQVAVERGAQRANFYRFECFIPVVGPIMHFVDNGLGAGLLGAVTLTFQLIGILLIGFGGAGEDIPVRARADGVAFLW